MLSHIGCRTLRRPRDSVGRLAATKIIRTKTSWVQRLTTIVGRLFVGTDNVDPKRVLERRYLYFGMIALRVREKRNDVNFSHLTMSELRQSVVGELDSEGIEKLSNGSLRGTFLEELTPQVEDVLQSFLKVDKKLFGEEAMSTIDSEKPLLSVPHSPLDLVDVESLKEILREEDATTLEDLVNLRQEADLNMDTDEKEQIPLRRLRKQYLQSKHAAIQILLDFHGIPVESSIQTEDSNDHELDIFGIEKDSQVDTDLLRNYQTINICRSALIRRELGYSLLCLRSSLNKNAGRGAFVDGKCQMGDLVAFQPGEIWPAEFLDNSPDVIEHFNDEVDECMTSLRFDDYLLDSRISPVTVLTQAGSFNPWALGHMINHPDKGFWPNCQSLMVDFEDSLPEEIVRYIPNSFAREGTWKTNVFGNRLQVLMPGICLLARRDCSNEELYYDYRLQSSVDLPEWYTPVIYNDDFMDKTRTVFFNENDKKMQVKEIE